MRKFGSRAAAESGVGGVQHVEQPRLGSGRERVDVLEAERAAGRLVHQRLLRPVGPSEEHGLELLGRDAGAVDLDQRLRGPRTARVDRAGDQALAGAGLADRPARGRRPGRRRGWSRAAARPPGSTPSAAASARCRRRARGAAPGSRACARAISPALRQSSASRSGSNGFSTKSKAPIRIASTAIGTSPWPVIRITGSPGSIGLQPAQQRHAVHAGHPDVADDDPGEVGTEHLQRRFRRLEHDGIEVRELHPLRDALAHVGLVVDDRDLGLLAHVPTLPPGRARGCAAA